MTKRLTDHGMFSSVQQRRTNHKDFQNYLFACFLSQVEPKKVIQALTNPSWIEVMQDEILQFKLQKVWTLVDLPYSKRDIGTKWVYRNKKDERGVVVRNKARLVAQGYTQEEEIDYDEVFAPVARIEAIRLFLAYASFMNFVMQKEDGIFISQDKYVDEILKKFGFSTVKTASTPIETSKPLMKDENAEDVDVHLYRSMIGSLMYLTSSRPNIIYLKGQPKLSLWYPKDSSYNLEAYTDSDYAGASLGRKYTTGGCQFLRSRLISWQCKKQTVVANFTTEAEYVAAANCYAVNDEIQVSAVGLTFYCFGQTATASTLDNGEMEITATIDGKVKIVTKASIRRHLKLEDSNGISNLSTTEIFEQLALMGQETEVPQPSSPPHTNVADEAASTGVDVRYGGAATTITGLKAQSRQFGPWSVTMFDYGIDQDSLVPGPQSQENVPQAAETVTTSNELELLYSPMFSELLNGNSTVVSKSSVVHAADSFPIIPSTIG
ncbi:ribonuclease H-like domain, reverse transcriptase, RNA-dependent DNA polymerase [Tanacetum coccineum]